MDEEEEGDVREGERIVLESMGDGNGGRGIAECKRSEEII